MEDETISFYHQNLGIRPEKGFDYACSYLKSLLNIFGNANYEESKGLKGMLRNTYKTIKN